MPTPATDRTLMFVAFICFIDMCGLGLVIPVLPSLIRTLADVSIDRAAEIGGLLLFCYAVMQFVFAPIIGGLSDRFGRRPVLLATLAALGFDYALMAAAPTLAWLFAGRVISGIMGATWAAANSCVADATTLETRGRAFGLLGAAGACGFVAGPAIGGLLGSFGDRVPFMAACVLALAATVVGWRILPETLAIDRRRPFSWYRANPFGNLMQMRKAPLVVGFLATIFFVQLAGQSQIAIWSYYTILKFQWTPISIGLSVALYGGMVALVQGGLSGPAFRILGEGRAGLIGICTGIPAYLLLAFAGNGPALVTGMIIGTVSNLAFPAMQSMATRATPEDAQGELQGAVASMVAITSIIGPLLMTGVFGAFTDRTGLYFPGAPFVVASALMGIAAMLYAATLRRF